MTTFIKAKLKKGTNISNYFRENFDLLNDPKAENRIL